MNQGKGFILCHVRKVKTSKLQPEDRSSKKKRNKFKKNSNEEYSSLPQPDSLFSDLNKKQSLKRKYELQNFAENYKELYGTMLNPADFAKLQNLQNLQKFQKLNEHANDGRQNIGNKEKNAKIDELCESFNFYKKPVNVLINNLVSNTRNLNEVENARNALQMKNMTINYSELFEKDIFQKENKSGHFESGLKHFFQVLTHF